MSKEGWFAPSYGVPSHVKDQIHQWVQSVPWPEGTKLKHPDKYHITSFYSPEGYLDPTHHDWLRQHQAKGFPAMTHSLDSFDSPNPNSGLKPVVMRFHAPELSTHAEQLMSEAEQRGLQPTRFEGGHKPHITVAEAPDLPDATPPQIHFQTEPLHELHTYYDSLKRQANILDPIHAELSPLVFDNPADPEPRVKAIHRQWLLKTIYKVLEEAGYEGIEGWLSLVFTGSLTTYQYSDESDVDISLFVDVDHFPEWSRAEMIGLMIEKMDGVTMPGTPHPLQCFVVPPEVGREDLYQPGMRSGYDLDNEAWIVPPERERVHNVEAEMSASYVHALQQADKMANLLKFEPDKAVMFWHQIHRRRRRDMRKGKGDYADSNITYKMLANRGLFPQISEVSGEYIAKVAADLDISALALQSTLTNGGITVGIDGTIPTAGYAFSPFKGLEQIIPVAALKEEDIDAFLDKNKQHLIKPENYLGIWVNGLNAYVDVTQVIEDFDLAYKLAWDADQLAMWDVAQGEEIPVREGGSTPLEIASKFRQSASQVAVELPKKWKPGKDGKFLVTPEGEVHHWQTDFGGSPHHQRYVMKHPDLDYDAYIGRKDGLGDAPNTWTMGTITPGGALNPTLDRAVPEHLEKAMQIPGVRNTNEDNWTFSALRPIRQVAKFVYSPLDNHLVVGAMAREEGEVESHYDLLRRSGLPVKNNVYGQFDESGRVVTFGRPKIEGYGKAAMTPYEADWRAKQALEQTIPGVSFETKINPSHDRWTIEGPPKVTYMREPPVIGGEPSEAEPDEWTFSKVAGSWSVDPRAIDKAATHLGLQHPVEVRVEGGTYGQYQGLQNGTHIIKAVEWVRPQTANEQIWHELVHAKQAENGVEFPDRPESYDEYRAQPHEQEAHDFEAPFPVVLPRGDSNVSDTSRAVPT